MINYDLQNQSISAGITSTLDGIEKNYFLGDSKKINDSITGGTTIDPYNNTFFSKTLFDKKNRPYRIKGKGDGIIKFEDGSCGIIDYKTSKNISTKIFHKLFTNLLKNDIFIAPSQYETVFLSDTHTDQDITKALGAYGLSLKAVKN